MGTRTAIYTSLTIPGRPEQVHAARQFVLGAMGAGHPGIDTAVLLSSELITNSVRHSLSGMPGGTITITVKGIPGGLRVEVLDAGGPSVPHVEGMAAAVPEGGLGLRMVSELSADWGYRHEGAGVVTWFEVAAEPDP